MDVTFFDAHDELYHHAKFGCYCLFSYYDRTTRAGCICENVMFVFSLPAGCHGNLSVLNLLCVSDQKSEFSPMHEKLCAGSKNDWHPLELLRLSLSACKIWGEIELREPAVGAKIAVFCMSRLVCLRVGGHSSKKYCVTVYGTILMPFSAIFFRRDCSVKALHGTTWSRINLYALPRQVAPQISRNCRRKLRKVQKSAEKFVRATSYR